MAKGRMLLLMLLLLLRKVDIYGWTSARQTLQNMSEICFFRMETHALYLLCSYINIYSQSEYSFHFSQNSNVSVLSINLLHWCDSSWQLLLLFKPLVHSDRVIIIGVRFCYFGKEESTETKHKRNDLCKNATNISHSKELLEVWPLFPCDLWETYRLVN